jgi:hypothetical protein
MRAFVRSHKRAVITAMLLCAAAACIVGYWVWERGSARIRVVLADGTSAVCMHGSALSTPAGYPEGKRETELDGECWMKVAAGGSPFVMSSRLMVLTVSGPARLHVVAWAAEPGEQVEVLQGFVRAAKNYASLYATPDELGAGEMSMVNQSSDLQEKEKLNANELAALQSAFAAL